MVLEPSSPSVDTASATIKYADVTFSGMLGDLRTATDAAFSGTLEAVETSSFRCKRERELTLSNFYLLDRPSYPLQSILREPLGRLIGLACTLF